ncbi:MAG: (deoxy)nucleoside triphosphate pyrophosphohydrolase [Erysipelotrichaceae bacterium]|nr:(deoxy)nucleoside triphosphate pyrophosphohydrolase [Erysipelotrichaceae bacterium]
MKTIRVVAAIIEKEGSIFVAKRLNGEFAGLWEFPGGKYEEGETGEEAIKREIREEFDVEINVDGYLCTVEHQYDTFYLVMDCFICNLLTDHMILHDHSDAKWINPYDGNVEYLPADKKVIVEYRKYLNQ